MGKTNHSFSHIEGISLDAGEEIYEFAGRAGDMGLGEICELGDRTDERHSVGVYGAGYVAGPLGRIH